MGEGFAKSEAQVTQIKRATEQYRQQIMRAAIRHGIHQKRKAFRVMRGQPIQPRMQAVKRLPMGR
ncbi:MAG: hypothetical protein RL312_1299, partial [Pseudomonadota bacterium]